MENTQHNDWQDSSGRPERVQTPVCWTVIGLSVASYILANMLGIIPENLLVFNPSSGNFFPSLLLHMVTHANMAHLAFNMLALYFLGTIVEQRYGTLRFALLFIISGIFAAFAQVAFDPQAGLIGASGAIAGVMAAFVRHYPFVRLYIYGILPMPAWLFIVLWIGYNVLGAGLHGKGIAFVAHLAGLAAGLVISLLIERPGSLPSRS